MNQLAPDRIHSVANLMMGLHFPRAWIRKLSANKREKLCKWLHNFWARANDNNVRRVHRPSWVPKRFIYG